MCKLFEIWFIEIHQETKTCFSKTNPFLLHPYDLLKGEVKQEHLPSREYQQRLYVEIYLKYIFHKGKKLQIAVLQSIPTEQTRKFNHPG